MVVSLICPLCRSALGESRAPREGGERCEHCGEYPRVGGVTLLLPQVEVAMHALREKVVEAWVAATKANALAERSARTPEVRDQDLRAAAARSMNQQLFERVAAPACESAARSRRPRGLGSAFPGSAGWSFDALLPYFMEDWAAPRADVRDRVLRDTAHLGLDRTAALVIGCGAGALVHDLAGTFEEVYGLDASIVGLLLARRILDGESIECHVEAADWQRITLQRDAPPAENVRLVAGDAHSLPFADASFTTVVTQFVLDVVGNPASVLHEVNRVLQPGGLWINDGIPCHFHDEPASPDARDGNRWPEHLRAFGFEPVEVARRMSPHLEASRGKWSQRVMHPVVHSVGRKTASLATGGAAGSIAAYLRGEKPDLRSCVPSLAPGREVWSMSRLGVGGAEGGSKVSIGPAEYRARDGETFSVMLLFLRALLSAASVGAVVEAVAATGVDPREVILALEALERAGHIMLGPAVHP